MSDEKRMGWEELSETQEFRSLTTKQQLAVCTYISNGYDVIGAIRTAYKCKNDHVAYIMSYRFLRSFGVTMVLSRHFGEDPLETFLNRLATDILKGKIPHSKLKAYELYAELKGWKGTAIAEAIKQAEKARVEIKNERLAARVAAEAAKPKREKKKEFHAPEPVSGGFDLSEFEE